MGVRTKHKHNVLTKSDIIFQEDLMREFAGAHVIFVAYLNSRSRALNLLLSFPVVSHEHHLKWFSEGILESVQEEDLSFSFLCRNVLHQVDKEALCSKKESEIKVNVNIKQFFCLHSCDQIVRLG